MTQTRPVTARWTLTATLEMTSASQIGSQASDSADSTFERDASGALVLRGSTLAGALRSALADRRLGYRIEEPKQNNEVAKLFGSATTRESALIVYHILPDCRLLERDRVREHQEAGLRDERGDP